MTGADIPVDPGMTTEKAWDILVSYCVGNRKYHTSDTVAALSWALNELKACEHRSQG